MREHGIVLSKQGVEPVGSDRIERGQCLFIFFEHRLHDGHAVHVGLALAAFARAALRPVLLFFSSFFFSFFFFPVT